MKQTPIKFIILILIKKIRGLSLKLDPLNPMELNNGMFGLTYYQLAQNHFGLLIVFLVSEDLEMIC